jgi:3-deoxy-D-manno-octulosonic-acid transferase
MLHAKGPGGGVNPLPGLRARPLPEGEVIYARISPLPLGEVAVSAAGEGLDARVSYLLNVAYLTLLAFASPWLIWAAVRHGKYRAGWGAKLLGAVPHRQGAKRCIWFHAVSVGEVQMLHTLLDRMAGGWSNWDCVVSTTTKAGYELAKEKYPNYQVFYCPLDFSWAVRTALRRTRPDLLVLVELELWPNLVAEAARRGVRVAVVNGRLSEKSFRGYCRIRGLIAPTLRHLSLIAAQDSDYADRFRRLGADPSVIHVSGSLKFDGARTDRGNPATQRLADLGGFAADDVVFLAGSTQFPEEQLAVETFQQLLPQYPQLRLVLVPRHPQRFQEVAEFLRQTALPWLRRSELVSPTGEFRRDPDARILLVDTIGELAAWWGTAHVAFVGGSMGSRGGQNMLEPAAYGAAVSFGPNTQNFRGIVELLLQHEAAVMVDSGTELTDFVGRCLDQQDWRRQLGDRARRLVLSQAGAADRTLEQLAKVAGTRDSTTARRTG